MKMTMRIRETSLLLSRESSDLVDSIMDSEQLIHFADD